MAAIGLLVGRRLQMFSHLSVQNLVQDRPEQRR